MLPEEYAYSRDCYSFGMMVEALIPLLNDYGKHEELSSALFLHI